MFSMDLSMRCSIVIIPLIGRGGNLWVLKQPGNLSKQNLKKIPIRCLAKRNKN
ncbi:unnamed protein product, partial [Nesidiocoris tenuis]